MGKVLVVEDYISIVNDLKNLLTEDGKEVLTADNGQAGLEILNNEPDISLCLSDINMPIMNGFEMLEQFRSGHPDSSMPIVMLTTEFDTASRKRGKSLGVKAWIIKPFEEKAILKCINKLIQ